MSAIYEATAARDGVEVTVRIELHDDAAKYNDRDELGEEVGNRAANVLARVVENIHAASLPF